jgi:hypothetical protein
MTSAYTINLNPNITTPVKTGYTFKSGDKGITFNIAVTEMDPTDTSAKIAFHRANGTSVEAALSGQGPTYSYTILGNEFAVPGVVVADVKFYQSTTQRVSTASFVFNVINDTLDGLGGGTAGYSDELETLRAEMEEAAEVLDDYIDAYGELKPLNPRGNYDAATTYHPCDMVYYNGASWVNTAESTGQAPSTGSAYWMKGVDLDTSKADKVVGATNGNFAGLDSNGNLTDSGQSPTSIDVRQPKTLATPITIGGIQQTTVEGALGGLTNEFKDLFTRAILLYSGSPSVGDSITLSDSINKYKYILIVDVNADSEASGSINTYYGSVSNYPAIIASIVDYNATYEVMVLADIAFVPVDATHYTLVRSAQMNISANGVAYFGKQETAALAIYGLN